MPKWGLAMKEGSVTSWLKNEGEEIKKGEVIVEIETEKVVNEFESPHDGILLRKILNENEKVSVGSLIGVLGEQNISSEEINKFVEDFQSNFVPLETAKEEIDLEKTILINNHSINYLNISDDKDENIIFIHGFGGDLNNWMFNQEELSNYYNTYALDLPGHGKSSKNIDFGNLNFLTDIIAKFCIEKKLKKVNIVGHSLGGGIGINLANENKDLVKSLILISPIGLGEEIDSYIKNFIEADSRKELKPELEKLYYDSTLITRDLVNEVLKFKRLDGVSESLNKIMKECIYENNKQKNNLIKILNNLKNKVDIIWGDEDKIIPSKHIKNLTSNVNCHILNNSGHMSHVEKSKEVNNIIKNSIN